MTFFFFLKISSVALVAKFTVYIIIQVCSHVAQTKSLLKLFLVVNKDLIMCITILSTIKLKCIIMSVAKLFVEAQITVHIFTLYLAIILSQNIVKNSRLKAYHKQRHESNADYIAHVLYVCRMSLFVLIVRKISMKLFMNNTSQFLLKISYGA